MKEHSLHFIMLSLLAIFVYGAVMQGTAYGQEKLKFPSKNIREMWSACSTEFRKILPSMMEETRMYLCDCYTDYMRKSFTPEQVIAMTSEQARSLGLIMRIKCPLPDTPQTLT
jgi:hypothetical protein